MGQEFNTVRKVLDLHTASQGLISGKPVVFSDAEPEVNPEHYWLCPPQPP